MSRQQDVIAIRERFDRDAALQCVTALAGTADARIEQKILYPYFQYRAHCSVPTLIGRRELRIDCLVEAINGAGSTADPFDTETMDVPDASLLAAKLDPDTARRIAQRTVTHRLGRKFRMIAPFDVRLESPVLVHRGFWIVRVGGGRVMVDSVTGAIQSLSASAA